MHVNSKSGRIQGIQGGLDEKKSKTKRTPKQYEWHAHHPRPKFMGGEVDQPLMGVSRFIHISVLHPMLNAYLKSKGYKVAPNKGPKEAPNRSFIDRMIADPIFKAEVMLDLKKFYVGLNALSNPTIPKNAYMLGMEYTFKNLK